MADIEIDSGSGTRANMASGHEAFDALVAATFGCDPDLARVIGAASRMRDYGARQTILDLDEHAGEVHLLALGRARMVANSLEGRLVVIEEYGAGDLFGMTGLFDPEPVPAQVSAVTDARSGAIAGHTFVGLMQSHCALAFAVSRLLLTRLANSNRRVAENATLSAAGRVHAELLRRARAGDAMTIRPAPVLAEFALSLQTTRETVSRAINALERRGIVSRKDDALVVVAPHRLEDLIY